MNSQILNNYRVLDLTDEKGAFCCRVLSNMGAEVIRVGKSSQMVSHGFMNAGKHSLSLTIESTSGQDLLKRLIKSADILVESFPPGYLTSLGLGYPELKRHNPRLIMASVTPFGQSGPWRDYKSSDLVDNALGGPMSVCGEPHEPPLKPYGAQAYAAACLFAANSILLALWQRHSSNRGQYIDIAIHECLAATLDHVLVRYLYEGTVAARQGSLYWNKAFRVFLCKDGYILLSISHQWETLVEWLASEDAAEDLTEKRWLDEAERQNNLAHIIAVLEKWTQKHTVDELLEPGQLMHFPWGRVASIPEMVNNPQLNERGFFAEVEDPESGKCFKYPGVPLKMSRSPWQVNPQMPAPGDYNFKIYHEELGLDAAEISRLMREGVI
jgi:crotonobetainyl-CoA:carnitine CoA-transferase CaiB-like acyl-CoA transferase